MKKQCLDCGEPIRGRADKKFCSDQCRNNYNNQLHSNATNYMRNINNILRKNRRILSELNPGDKTSVHKDRLTDKGFNFNYHTNVYTTKKGHVYYFCYEHGFIKLENDFYALVLRKEYVI